MNLKLTPKKLHNYLYLSLFQRHFITNLNRHCPSVIGRALIYYKTAPLTPLFINEYTHTNNWEITQQVKILNQLGFNVDVIDRNIRSNFTLKDHYDIFIGLGLDGSGRHYTRLTKQIPSATKILYAATSNPDIRNKKLNDRYQAFSQRNNHQLPPFRFIKNINVSKTMSLTDHIFCVANQVVSDGFSKYNKPTHRIFLSTSPKLTPAFPLWHSKRTKNFLFFSGDGNILKGLDLLIETFSKLPNLNLYVCTNIESSFLNFYKPLINSSNNIHIENFLIIGSKRFQELTSLCGYTILPTCSDASATSITTCMRRGLIPITTPEASLNLDNFGITIKNIELTHLKQNIVNASQIPKPEFTKRAKESLLASYRYTQQSYTKSFTQSLFSVIQQTDKLRTKAILPSTLYKQ